MPILSLLAPRGGAGAWARRLLERLPPGWKRRARVWIEHRRERRLRRALAAAGLPDFEPLDFNGLLHWLRGRELDRLPKGVGEFLSVGCAGTWYFHWIEKHCGPIGRHIGIEFYSPRPHDLPPGVEWIANTAGDLSDIASASADLVFSGQNIEHLWPRDVAGFLLESHRVLRSGGLLVIDSPNRDVTRQALWSHPEHTLEFTPAEIGELLALAGFELQSLRGLWTCVDPRTGRTAAVARLEAEPRWPLKQRIESAADHPEHAFVWWVQARRGGAAPDAERLRMRVLEIFRAHWTERVRRMLTIAGRSRPGHVFATDGQAGALMYGPYMPLPAGDYTVTLRLDLESRLPPGQAVAICEVVVGAGDALARAEVKVSHFQAGTASVPLRFSLGKMTFGIEFRVMALVPHGLAAHGDVRLESHSDPLYSTRG